MYEARNQGGGQTRQSKSPTKFVCIILDFHVHLFHLKPLNKLLTILVF